MWISFVCLNEVTKDWYTQWRRSRETVPKTDRFSIPGRRIPSIYNSMQVDAVIMPTIRTEVMLTVNEQDNILVNE
jgi:hypothetical protein